MEVYPQNQPAATGTTVYQIKDGAGNHVADHVREDQPDGTKQVFWRRPSGKWGLNGTKLHELPFYGSESVKERDEDALIVLTEGEPARDALAAAGIPALGTVCGAGVTPGEEALEVLRDRRVCLWGDNDPQGRQHMAKIASALHPIAAEVLLYEWHGAPEKGDAADHPATKNRDPETVDRLLTDLEDAPRWEPEPPEPAPPARDRSRATINQGFNLTDLGNAERLIARHGHDLRYCYAWGKWVVWDGRRWETDDGGAVELMAKATVRGIYAEAAEAEDDARRKELADHAKRSEARSRIEAMISLAQSEPGVPVRPDKLDSDPWLFNTPTGTFDFRTGRLRPHDRFDLLTKMAGTGYDPDAEAPTWEVFLEKVLPSPALRRFVQRLAGYCLTGNVSEQILPFAYGPGANGKTTAINALLEVLGDYGQQAAPDLLLAKHGSHPTELADLFGARLVASVEIEDGRRLAEGLVKQLTGGDRIKARRMREDFWEFAPTHKVFLAANHKPEVRGTDHAIWRRIKLIPFDVSIPKAEQDPRLPEKLRAERAGILAWAVEGCLEWQRDGLGEPDEVKAATESYRGEMDVLAAFISDECVVGERASVGATLLYTAYKSWCEENGEKSETQTKFGRRLGERGFTKEKAQRVTWYGIGLRDDRPDPEGGRRQFGGPVDSLDSSSILPSGPTPSEPSNEGGQAEASSANCLNAENPTDKGDEPDPRRRLDSFRPISNINGLPIAHEELIPEKGLQPSNCLKPPSVGQGTWPGEVDFDDMAEDTPEKLRPVTQPGRRLTEEEVEQVRKLMFEGMSPASARAEVVGEEEF